MITDESGCPSGRAPSPSAVGWRVGLPTPSGRRQSAGERNSRLLAVRDWWLLSAALLALRRAASARTEIVSSIASDICLCAHAGRWKLGVACCAFGGVGIRASGRTGPGLLPPVAPAGASWRACEEPEQDPDKVMPPRKPGPELRRAPACDPKLDRECDTPPVEPDHRPPHIRMPPTAHPQTPIPTNLPPDFFNLFHHVAPETNEKNTVGR